MIEELRALFAELYAVGCEHENYAYALSNELNAEVDAAMLTAFKSDLENLVLRCSLVSDTEKYALERMTRGRVPDRPRIWWKFFRRVPNPMAKVVDALLAEGISEHVKGMIAQVAQIEREVKMSQQGDREEPEEDADGLVEPVETPETPDPAPEEPAPQDAPKKAAETPPGDGEADGAELWDAEEFDEESAKKRKQRRAAGKRGRAKSEKPKRTTPPGDAE